MSRKKSTLPQLQPWEYNPTTLEGLDIRDLRALYTQKRDIAQKRLKRLKQSEFRDSDTARKYSDGIPTLKSIKATAEKDIEFEKQILVVELSDLNLWLENRYSLVGEQKRIRDAALFTLEKHGYNFVNEKNYQDFVDFQNYLTNTRLSTIYDSSGAYTDEVPENDEEKKPTVNDVNRLKNLFNLYQMRGGSLPVDELMRLKNK